MTEAPRKQSFFGKYWWLSGIVIALVMVFVLAPNASSHPDGLNKVAEDKGFASQEEPSRYEWLPNYSIPGVESEYWSTVLSGAIGVGIMVVVVGGVAYGLTRVRRMRDGASA